MTFTVGFAVALAFSLLLLSRSRRARPTPLPSSQRLTQPASQPLATPLATPRETPQARAATRPEPMFAPLRVPSFEPPEPDFSAPPDDEVTLLYRGAPDVFEPAPPHEGSSDGLDSVESRRPSGSRVKVCYEEEADEDETTSPLARILISARGDSDTGKTRRENQDSLLFLPERSLYAVADGMGGYRGGEVASSLAVDTLRQAFETESFGNMLAPSQGPLPRRGHELASAIVQSNVAVSEAARKSPELSQMGTTLVAARFSPNKQRVYIGHVGDSRCYRLRGGKLRQLTTDQTMHLVGMRGPGSDHLLQAIGVTRNLAIDLIVDKPRPDDVYLLCSDGLPKMASDEEIAAALLAQPDLEAAVYGLIELANDKGGRDNVSVILVKVIERAAASGGWSKPPDRASLLDVTGDEEVTV
ncbi:MAG TPA: protein phosphatase 2C domain-containing protein, partial [Polyangiaceae bacterium]|nr:protein phosphatase 2C domain-containing protein [Polyangiaceae bacterium]